MHSENRNDYFRRVVSWIVEAARAIAYAHDNGVLHRDIKPANLLLDADGRVWIADFGLARLESDITLTMTGDIMGTLRYTSPEQALGRRLLVDQRTDIYALGVTLYELITWQPAFGANSREELLRQVCFEEPLPPRQIDNLIPKDLETIVLKAICKEAEERYFSSDELANDLQRFLDGVEIQARRRSYARKFSRFLIRYKAATTLVVTTLLIAICVIFALQWNSANKIRKAYSDISKKNQELIVAKTISENARSVSDQSYRIATDAIDAFFTKFRDNILESQPGMDEEIAWTWDQNVELNRQLLEIRPKDRELKFQAARVLNGYAIFAMNRLNDSTDYRQLVDEAQRLLEKEPTQGMSFSEMEVAANVLILRQHMAKAANDSQKPFEKINEIIEEYSERLTNIDPVDTNKHARLLRMFHNLLLVLPEGAQKKNVALKAVGVGRELFTSNPTDLLSKKLYAAALKDASKFDQKFLDNSIEVLEVALDAPDHLRKLHNIDLTLAATLQLRTREMPPGVKKEEVLERIIQLTDSMVNNEPQQRDPIAYYVNACTQLGKLQTSRLAFAKALGAYEKATKALEKILKLSPDDREFSFHLREHLYDVAVVYAAQRNLEEFDRIVERVVTFEGPKECLQSIIDSSEERMRAASSAAAKHKFESTMDWVKGKATRYK